MPEAFELRAALAVYARKYPEVREIAMLLVGFDAGDDPFGSSPSLGYCTVSTCGASSAERLS